MCTGRISLNGDLGLEAANVGVDEKEWILANEFMETTAEGVYAIGDAIGPNKKMLAHVASMEARVAAQNTMGSRCKMSYDAVPMAVFTSPEVACVGLTEAEAQEQGYAIKAGNVLFRAIGKAHVIGDIAGEAKIVSDAKSGKILGVHLIGPHVTELIAEGVFALKNGSTLQDIVETIHPHPTLSEIMFEASLKILKEGNN